MLLGAMVLTVAALPVVAVERAPGCPDVAALVADLDLQLDPTNWAGVVAGSRGDHRLRVDRLPGDGLHVEVVDASGRVRLSRELTDVGSCGARSRAIAVVIERWLAGLPVPRANLSARVVGRPPRGWLGVYSGTAVTAGLEPFDLFVGLVVGTSVRPIELIRFTLDGALNLPHQLDADGRDLSLLRGVARLRVAGVMRVGRVDLETGPTLRFDLTSVSSSVGSRSSSVLRVQPSIGLAAGSSLGIGTRGRVGVLVEAWAALDGQRFYLPDETTQVVYRTPFAGLQVDLVGGYELF